MEDKHLLGNLDEEDGEEHEKKYIRRHALGGIEWPWKIWLFVLSAFLSISIFANIFQYWYFCHFSRNRSAHAGVADGIQRSFFTNTEWSSDNKSHADMLWTELTPDAGMVVLDHDYSKKMGLYKTQPFPWDNSKGIYMLEGYHSLHCLMYIYRALREFEQDIPQTTPMHHHIHCLDALRENAICSADDTLRPAGTGQATPQVPGLQPVKQCRDWKQLEKWAIQNSACFKRYPDHDPNHRTLEEWRNCPAGSPFISIVEEFFGGG